MSNQSIAAGRLQARPGAHSAALKASAASPSGTAPVLSGRSALGLDQRRDVLCYVPSGYQAQQPVPLALLLHGAGGAAEAGIQLLQPLADATGIILLSPASRGRTWDVILSSYGPDVMMIDQALTQTFEHYAIDPQRVVIGGFSDGASYALSLGLTNGDLFTHVMAFSPGFLAPAAQRGMPRIFISHGIHDTVLPIDRCSRRIAPRLEQAGYDLHYQEFDGPHTVPPQVVRDAVAWFLEG